eukprot:4397992-Amphidinium_carterae.1
MDAVKRNHDTLEFAPEPFRNDIEFMEELASSTPQIVDNSQYQEFLKGHQRYVIRVYYGLAGNSCTFLCNRWDTSVFLRKSAQRKLEMQSPSSSYLLKGTTIMHDDTDLGLEQGAINDFHLVLSNDFTLVLEERAVKFSRAQIEL